MEVNARTAAPAQHSRIQSGPLMKSPFFIHVAVLIALTVLVSALAKAAEPVEPRRSEIVRMVRQDCGSCHGLTLQGGLGPALTPTALAQRPLDSLVWTVLQGRPGTAMPGWSRFLDEAEVRWIIGRLAEGFPQDVAQGSSR